MSNEGMITPITKIDTVKSQGEVDKKQPYKILCTIQMTQDHAEQGDCGMLNTPNCPVGKLEWVQICLNLPKSNLLQFFQGFS